MNEEGPRRHACCRYHSRLRHLAVRNWPASSRLLMKAERRCGARFDETTGGEIVKGIPNKDEAKGAFERAKGTVKEAIGSAVGNESLEREGELDQTKGRVRQELGEARRKVGEKIEELGDTIKS